MKRYVLRYAGGSPNAANDSGSEACQLVQRAGGRVIDDTPTMLLIEGTAATGAAIAKLLPDWVLSLDVITPLPAVPRPAVRSSRRTA